MFNHQPGNYICPFCELIVGKESEHNKFQDIVFQNEFAAAFIAPQWWINNHGHVLVVPNKHYENLYDIPDEVLGKVYGVVKKVAVALRNSYGCKGISTRQHNEPVGDQDVWHFHVHVYPRYENDDLYKNHDNRSYVDADKRRPYADKLREYLG